MKRYEIIGDPRFDLMEFRNGNLIRYDEFCDFIETRIKEIEEEIDFINKSVFSGSMSAGQRLNRLRGIKKELKNLISYERK